MEHANLAYKPPASRQIAAVVIVYSVQIGRGHAGRDETAICNKFKLRNSCESPGWAYKIANLFLLGKFGRMCYVGMQALTMTGNGWREKERMDNASNKRDTMWTKRYIAIWRRMALIQKQRHFVDDRECHLRKRNSHIEDRERYLLLFSLHTHWYSNKLDKWSQMVEMGLFINIIGHDQIQARHHDAAAAIHTQQVSEFAYCDDDKTCVWAHRYDSETMVKMMIKIGLWTPYYIYHILLLLIVATARSIVPNRMARSLDILNRRRRTK